MVTHSLHQNAVLSEILTVDSNNNWDNLSPSIHARLWKLLCIPLVVWSNEEMTKFVSNLDLVGTPLHFDSTQNELI